MSATPPALSVSEDIPQRRTKSSVLKSLIHKRTLSKDTGLSSMKVTDAFQVPMGYSATSFLPEDHPHANVLGELQQNHRGQQNFTTKKSTDGGRPKTNEDTGQPLHKKTLSTISLKSLRGKDPEGSSKAAEDKSWKPKKTKSSTNLAALLSRPRSIINLQKATNDEDHLVGTNKENRTPSNSSPTEPSSNPPIYAQFATEFFTTQPLGGKFLEDEIDLYTPQQYSPGKQRNFHGLPGSGPTLGSRDVQRRPKSTYLPSTFSVHDINKYVNPQVRHSTEQPRDDLLRTPPLSECQNAITERKIATANTNRGAKVFGALTALNNKPRVEETKTKLGNHADIQDVDGEFEKMLDRRNIPEHQRHKMRSLAVSMKLDFIRQDRAETAVAHAERPGKVNVTDFDGESCLVDTPDIKTKRPRSRTFTLSKSSKESSSPTKKAKSDTTLGHMRSKSSESVTGSTKASASSSAKATSKLIAKTKGQLPGDFVAYLRKMQKPESVEVGKLHKLRLLLRNETVAWTDEFIALGGMDEIVSLLHRTIEVEWREEHEDALLHEVLLCLKALCTTALALQNLNEIQNTLFPALIHMLFDEEKKGPSEFTTRNIVSSLLFTYLKSAPLPERCHRAQTLLSYLRDPQPKEEERPVGFVLEMRRDRPYKIWCKELVNVTKEVFWIFLHNLNVVSLPSTDNNLRPSQLFAVEHFPEELPPVAAAPYVGGVEWDATNYLASHLEILNGILCSLPNVSERNALREQLRLSGWERCMGGTLRLCKEKFYGGVHAGLRCWVAAAVEDGWDTRDVRCGPKIETARKSPKKSPNKRVEKPVPMLEMPKLDFGDGKGNGEEGGWL